MQKSEDVRLVLTGILLKAVSRGITLGSVRINSLVQLGFGVNQLVSINNCVKFKYYSDIACDKGHKKNT